MEPNPEAGCYVRSVLRLCGFYEVFRPGPEAFMPVMRRFADPVVN
ncbi:hypothetical protein Adu01nite_80100 [Paractinoplanes durhamensis]|uniref:Uncharacterized protein n=1 Tax=Paractinoplanes durhamensis TaxID=113563 RepID=A0ABQ3ZA16_9ACTN|nr:hypothetical protein Adu01nite_80100 [Actinoplanes durhamensis]